MNLGQHRQTIINYTWCVLPQKHSMITSTIYMGYSWRLKVPLFKELKQIRPNWKPVDGWLSTIFIWKIANINHSIPVMSDENIYFARQTDLGSFPIPFPSKSNISNQISAFTISSPSVSETHSGGCIETHLACLIEYWNQNWNNIKRDRFIAFRILNL